MVGVKEVPQPEAAKGQGQATQIERRPVTTPMLGFETPFALMHRFAVEMDRLFEDPGLRLPRFVTRGRELLRRETGLVPAAWPPRVDVLQQDDRYIVRADLPGLTKDNVKVELNDEMLITLGERKQENTEECEGYSYNEYSYGSFYRSKKASAEGAVRHLLGVCGVRNEITVTSRASATDVQARIEAACRRGAELDAQKVRVEMHDGKVTLHGELHSWAGRQGAERTAWVAPGVSQVEDPIAITPWRA